MDVSLAKKEWKKEIMQSTKGELADQLMTASVEIQYLKNKVKSVELLRELLREANEELDSMTYLDCPEFVERDEELAERIDAALKEGES